MLYSGIHYVSPAGDFCPKLRVLNLQKIEKTSLKWKQLTDILKEIENFNSFWKQDKKQTLKNSWKRMIFA